MGRPGEHLVCVCSFIVIERYFFYKEADNQVGMCICKSLWYFRWGRGVPRVVVC